MVIAVAAAAAIGAADQVTTQVRRSKHGMSRPIKSSAPKLSAKMKYLSFSIFSYVVVVVVVRCPLLTASNDKL